MSNCANTSIGEIPFVDATALDDYNGYEITLYPGGNDLETVAPAHYAEGVAAGIAVRRLDASGVFSPTGRKGLLAVGMSNTNQEWDRFEEIDGSADSFVVTVNGAQGGQGAADMADPGEAYWDIVDTRIASEGLTPAQIQWIWFKTAEPGTTVSFPTHAETLRDNIKAAVIIIASRYPNCKGISFSSRSYGGYATSTTSPEPWAYEGGFAVKWVIEQQINHATTGDPNLAYGLVPWLGWGPYIWADGTTPNAEGLSWDCADFRPDDGTHPATSGRQKVADKLWTYLSTSPYTSSWYIGIPAVYELGSLADNTNAASYGVTCSAPTAYRAAIVAVFSRMAGATPNEPTLSGLGLTWVKIETRTFATEALDRSRLTMFRAMGSITTSGTLTIDFGGQTQLLCNASVMEVSGVETGGSNASYALAQTIVNSADAQGALTITLTQQQRGEKSVVIAAFATNDSTGITPEAGWTLLHSLSSSGDAGRMMTTYTTIFDSTATGTMASGLHDMAGIAIELITPIIRTVWAGANPGLQLVLLEEAGGRTVVDFSPDVIGLVASDGPHGYEMLQANVDLILRQAARYYSDRRVLHASLNFGPETVWEGRLEDRRLNDSGLGLSSFGYWRAMFDAPYTALWSKSGAAGWEWATSDNNPGFVPERFEGDNNNRLYIAPRQDEDYDDGSAGAWSYATPHNGERPIVAIDFDYVLDAPADWSGSLSYAEHDIFIPTTLWLITSTGAPLVGTMSITTAPASTKQRLIFAMFYNNATLTTFTGETGTAYLKITNIRIATTTTNRVNTTLGTNIAAGSQTVTPASMANIYVGQQLRIKQNTVTAETVVVTAVTATTFTATFANAHITTDAVNAIVVYADEIAEALVDFVEALNPGHINDSKVSIEAHGLDLTDELYEDVYPADILNDLAARGDGNGQQWEVGIRNGRRLFFRPKGSDGQTWYVDAAGLELERTLNAVANSVYAIYRDNNDMTRRTDAAANALSVQQYGLTRRMAFPASTTRLVQAEEFRTAALAYYSNPPPRQMVEFDQLWTAGGALVRHKWQVRAGDTIVLRNVDPTLLADDQAITFRIGRVHYDAATDRLAVEPEIVSAPYIAMLINGTEFVPRELPEGYIPGAVPNNPPPGQWPGHPEGVPYEPPPGQWPGHD